MARAFDQGSSLPAKNPAGGFFRWAGGPAGFISRAGWSGGLAGFFFAGQLGQTARQDFFFAASHWRPAGQDFFLHVPSQSFFRWEPAAPWAGRILFRAAGAGKPGRIFFAAPPSTEPGRIFFARLGA